MGHDHLKESQDVSEDSGVLLGLVKREPAEKRPGSPLSTEKKMDLGQDWHPGAAWMGMQVGRGAAWLPSIPGQGEPAVSPPYMFSW